MAYALANGYIIPISSYITIPSSITYHYTMRNAQLAYTGYISVLITPQVTRKIVHAMKINNVNN